VDAGLKANEWTSSVSSLMKGKGGGKAESAQAIGSNTSCLQEAISKATEYVHTKLNITPPHKSTVEPAKSQNSTKTSKKSQSTGGSVYTLCGADQSAVLISANYSSLTVQQAPTDNGSHTVCLTTPAGEKVRGTAAAAYCLSTQQLAGHDLLSQTQVLEWCSFADKEVKCCILGWVLPLIDSKATFNKQSVDASQREAHKIMDKLNSLFLHQTYAVGERVTLGDIHLMLALLPAYQHVLDETARRKYRSLTRWFNTIAKQPHINTVIGDVQLCSKPITTPAKAKSKN